jgi:hypothetical protein
MAGAEGFEPPSSVLETDSLTVELTPLFYSFQLSALSFLNVGAICHNQPKSCWLLTKRQSLELLSFLMSRVLPAALTELREFQTTGGRLLVLRRRVITLLALTALQRNNFPHLPILTDLGQLFSSEDLAPASVFHTTRALSKSKGA